MSSHTINKPQSSHAYVPTNIISLFEGHRKRGEPSAEKSLWRPAGVNQGHVPEVGEGLVQVARKGGRLKVDKRGEAEETAFCVSD